MAKQEETNVESFDNAETPTAAPVAPTAGTRPRKLAKAIEGTTLTITENTTGTVLAFDFLELSADIQQKLGVYGLSQKLGDAAAGKSGQEAIDAINKVADGLKTGDWSVRAPAAPKVTKKDIAEKVSNMSPKEQEAAKALLAKLNIKL